MQSKLHYGADLHRHIGNSFYYCGYIFSNCCSNGFHYGCFCTKSTSIYCFCVVVYRFQESGLQCAGGSLPTLGDEYKAVANIFPVAQNIASLKSSFTYQCSSEDSSKEIAHQKMMVGDIF